MANQQDSEIARWTLAHWSSRKVSIPTFQLLFLFQVTPTGKKWTHVYPGLTSPQSLSAWHWYCFILNFTVSDFTIWQPQRIVITSGITAKSLFILYVLPGLCLQVTLKQTACVTKTEKKNILLLIVYTLTLVIRPIKTVN